MDVDKVAGVFDRAAPTYDRVGIDFFQPVGRALVAAVRPQPTDVAVDLGCGRGAALFPLADTVQHVTGIDLAPMMVELTRADAAGRDNVTVMQGDAATPDLPSGHFDIVTASLVAFFMPDPLAAMQRWVALLRPGGRLGISSFRDVPNRMHDLMAIVQDYLPPRRVPKSVFHADDTVAQLLRDAGLREVTTTHLSFDSTFENEEQFHRYEWSNGRREAWEHIPVEWHAEVRTRMAEMLASYADADGKTRFETNVRLTVGIR